MLVLPASSPTPQIRVLRGDVRGISLTCIDTPGLHAASDAALANRGLLRSVARAYKKHKPDFVIYVDRWAAHAYIGCSCSMLPAGQLARLCMGTRLAKPSVLHPTTIPLRLDAARPSFGELSVLTQLGETLGKGVWRNLMVVLTHANAARDKLGAEYSQVRGLLGCTPAFAVHPCSRPCESALPLKQLPWIRCCDLSC